jgi:hypothetical protein
LICSCSSASCVITVEAEEWIVSHNKPNFDEGINPPEDKKKQKPNKTTSGDQTGEARSDHKVEDLAKAGRDDMDTDEGAE